MIREVKYDFLSDYLYEGGVDLADEGDWPPRIKPMKGLVSMETMEPPRRGSETPFVRAQDVSFVILLHW